MNHARCRQYIAMHFGEEAAENVLVYEDFSGGNLERPQFKKMMKDSQKIAFAAIVVYRLDRISRNIGDFAECAEFDGAHGIMVYNRSLQRPGMRKDTAELCRVFLHILFPMRRLSPPCSSGSRRQ